MTGVLILGACLLAAIGISVVVMSLFVGYPFRRNGSAVRSDDEMLDRVDARFRAGEDHGDALLDELRRPR